MPSQRIYSRFQECVPVSSEGFCDAQHITLDVKSTVNTRTIGTGRLRGVGIDSALEQDYSPDSSVDFIVSP